MGFGIGLGAFVDGMARGYGIRTDMQDREQAQVDRERSRARQDKADAWAEEDRARQTKLQAREDRTLNAIDQINEETRQQFDDGVKAGTAKPDQFDEFWTKYALPKMRNELLLNGDVQGASQLQDWADTEDAKKGAKLFSSALLKAQTGDGGGALDDAMAAGKLKGYLDHGLELSDKEEIKDANGNVVGYRVTLKDGDNLIHQDIALEDIPNVIATFANPEAAFQSQQASKAARAKHDEDMNDYREKKQIDNETEGDSKYRQKAIEALRKRFEDERALNPEQPSFDQITPDEQEQLISDEIGLQRGTRQPPAPQPQMLVDGATGQPVPTGLTGQPAAPADPNLGLGGVPTAQPAIPAPTMSAPAAPAANAPAQISGAAMVPEMVPQAQPGPSNEAQTNALKIATTMVNYGRLDQARAALENAGVPQSQWPPGLLSPQPPR